MAGFIKNKARTNAVTEKLLYSDYITPIYVNSVYLEGVTVLDHYQFRCPNCGLILPELKHGEHRTCPTCDLQMQLYGNGLTIWRD